MSAPAVTMLLADAASGKTTAALRELAAPRRGRAVLLLPGSVHRRRLRASLAGLRRVRPATFSSLAAALLRRAGERAELAGEGLRAALLRAELGRLAAAGAIPRFARVAARPGFVAEALRLIDELQASAVPPARLADAGVSVYDAELAAIYGAYGEAMARLGLHDEHGLVARAIALAEARPELTRDYGLLVVDGFDQFAPLQLGLLRALAARVPRTLITLTGDGTDRPALRRFTRTLAALGELFPEAEVRLLNSAGVPGPHPALAAVQRRLFDDGGAASPDAGGAIAVIAAPDREREVRAALRHVKGLIEGGAEPGDVALLYRGGEHYPQLVREVAAEYGLPVALFEGRTLGAAPPVLALRELLALPGDLGPERAAGRPSTRRAFVESWRALGATPTTTVGAQTPLLPDFVSAARLLDRATRGGHVANGLARLRAALAGLAEAAGPQLLHESPFGGPPVSPAEADELLALLDAFVAWLEPPAEGAPEAYVSWVYGVLGWGDDLPAGADQAPAHERLPLTVEQRAMLRRTLAERERIARLLGGPPVSYAAFVAELGSALDAARYGGEMPAHDKVAVLPFLAARGLTFEHVVILGAAEGEIPIALPAPPFYTRRERVLLSAVGAAPAPADPGDERSIFYEAICRARASLVFSYTRLDESGNELRPSPYLRAVAECFVAPLPTREIRAGSAPEPEEAASIQERLIALAARDADLSGPTLPASAELAAHIRRAATIERWREGLGPHGPFEGLVEDEAVLAELASRFGTGYRWSVTQINDFTICAYRFAAAHVLQLGARGDPEESLEQAGRGRLLHAILAEAGNAWTRLALPFDAAAEAPILDALDAAADRVLAVAPQVYGFEPGLFWPWEQAEAKATVTRAVRRWLRDPRGWEGFRPAGVEAGFGMGTGLPALHLDTPGGDALVIGRIDRIDQDEQGRLALIDYKSGGTPKGLAETLEGWDVQLTVYSLAAEGLGGHAQRVAQAATLMIGSGRRGRALTATERPQAEQALRERLGAAIAGSRGGAFPVRPSRECPPSCQFMTICRVNLAKRESGE